MTADAEAAAPPARDDAIQVKPALTRTGCSKVKVLVLVIGFIMFAGIFAILVHYRLPVLSYISLCLILLPVIYCAFYYDDENPPFKLGGGNLLFNGALTDSNSGRWNILVDVIVVGVGLACASELQARIKFERQNDTRYRARWGGIFSNILLASVFIFLIFKSSLESCWRRAFGSAEDTSSYWSFFSLKRRLVANNGTVNFQPHSVYADPAVSLWSVLLKVLVPQLIAIVLYLLSFFLVKVNKNGWAVAYAILGAFFGPITLVALNLPNGLEDADLLDLAAGAHRIYDKKGQKIAFDCGHFRRIIHILANIMGSLFLIGSLPLFLARSEHQLEFVLNAMAMMFVLTLDDIPAGKRNTYTFTDPKYSDPENPDAAADPYRPWAHAVTRDAETGSPTSARSEREHTNQDTTSPARDLESG